MVKEKARQSGSRDFWLNPLSSQDLGGYDAVGFLERMMKLQTYKNSQQYLSAWIECAAKRAVSSTKHLSELGERWLPSD